MNEDTSRAPKPDNLKDAAAEADSKAEPEAAATETEAATAGEAGAESAAKEPAGDADVTAAAEAEPEASEEAEVEPEAEDAAKAAKNEEPAPAEGDAADGAEPAEPGDGGEPEAAAEGEGGEPEANVTAGAGEADVTTTGDRAEEERSEEMVAELVAARAEAESYLDDLRRLQAEFDNYRKRTAREQSARVASASQALVSRLLPVLDNFELAVSHAEQSRDFDRMLKGVEMVFGELRETLASEGLVPIEAEGKPFDPGRHEAVVAVEQEGAEQGTVVDVIRKGYEFNGRVLRPAMVKVAR